jgi:hypothetical protein
MKNAQTAGLECSGTRTAYMERETRWRQHTPGGVFWSGMRTLAVLVVSVPSLAQASFARPALGYHRNSTAYCRNSKTDVRVEVHTVPASNCTCARHWFWSRFSSASHRLVASSASPLHVQIREWELPATFIYRFQRPPEPFMRTGISFNRVFDISGAIAARGGHWRAVLLPGRQPCRRTST